MEIQRLERAGCVVLAIAGRLDMAAAPQVRRALLKCAAGQPVAIVCDLSGVESVDPACATVFSPVAHPAVRWPDATVVLCCARPAVAAVLLRLRVPHFAPCHDTLDEAAEHACSRPRHLLDLLRLTPTRAAARRARSFVAEVCGRWGLDELTDKAKLVASELVTNAVVHARTGIELRLERRDGVLSVAVHDEDPRLLRLVEPGRGAESGRGLIVVAKVARSWGVRPDPRGGKVVWCTLSLAEQT